MTLINCPECSKKVSDTAKSCPSCGYLFPQNDKVPEKQFYPYIAKWLEINENCKPDEFSHGYSYPDVQIGNTKAKVDVLGMEYKKFKQITPAYDFIGYAVECKISEIEIKQDIGKLDNLIAEIENINKGKDIGFNHLNFYIAYICDFPAPEIISTCKKNRIGILSIRVENGKFKEIKKWLPPEPIELIHNFSHKNQKTEKNWSHRMLPKNLGVLFKNPEDFFNEKIKPLMQKRTIELAIKRYPEKIKNDESKKAYDYIVDRIKSESTELELSARKLTGGDMIEFLFKENIILSIRPTRNYFYLYLDDAENPFYKIQSKCDILRFQGNSDVSYNGDLKKFISEVISPFIQEKIAKISEEN